MRSINTVDDKIDREIEGATAHPSPILVLSRFSVLIETVRKAAPRGAPVVQAPDLDNALEKIQSLHPGVLVTDTASTSDIAAMVAQLVAHCPTLVVVAAGQREDSANLMQLTASGQIFRFLLMPLSHGQTRLALEAAIVEHKRLSVAPPRMEERSAPKVDEKKSDVTGYAAFAVGLALFVAGIWWVSSHTTSEPEAPLPAVATKEPPPNAAPRRPDPLTLAQQAFARGEYVEPAGTSALDYYRSALSIDPTNAAAQAGIRSVADKILDRAESALTAQKLERAVAAIETARAIDPQHPRLAFLDALVAPERIKRAPDTDRRIDQQPSSPPDSRNSSAANRPPRTLPLVKTPSPTPNRLKDPGKEELVANIRGLLNAGKLIDPKGDNAKDALTLLRSTDPSRAEISELTSTLSTRLLESGKQALASKAFDRSQQLLSAARDVGAPENEAAISEAERELTDARTNAAGDTNRIVSATTLRRIRTVEPVYPIAARRRKEKGMVELVFTVTPSGSVEDVEVRKSSPELVFDDAAKKAVEQWRFEPVKVDGRAVSQRAVVRLLFSLD